MPRLFLTGLLLTIGLTASASPNKGDIKKAFKSGDKGRVESVLSELKGSLDKGAVKAVFDNALRLRNLGVYDALVDALRTSKGEALTELVKYAKKGKKGNLRFLALDALGGIKGMQAEGALLQALKKDKDEPVRVLAARQLGKRGTKSAVDALIPILEGLEKDKKASERLIKEVVSAIQNLTGKDMVVAEDWVNYWKFNREKHTAKTLEAGKSKARGNVIERMKQQRPADLKTIKRVKKSELVVIRGRSDKVQDVLKGLGLEHKLINRDEFDSLKLDGKTGILLLNCPGRDKFTDEQIQKIRRFVGEGGYLFASDWDLKKTLAKGFPECVTFLKESPKGSNKTVKILPAPGARQHPLMRDVFPLNTFDNRGFSWIMEQRSHLVKDNKFLTPLVACPEIKNLGSTTVAFTFRWDGRGGGRVITGGKKKRKVTGRRGKGSREYAGGRVLFVSSHFKLQKDEKGDGYALQQLLLNFILEKQQRKTGKRKK